MASERRIIIKKIQPQQYGKMELLTGIYLKQNVHFSMKMDEQSLMNIVLKTMNNR